MKIPNETKARAFVAAIAITLLVAGVAYDFLHRPKVKQFLTETVIATEPKYAPLEDDEYRGG